MGIKKIDYNIETVNKLENDYIQFDDVCYKIKVKSTTLSRWYRWYDLYCDTPLKQSIPNLPPIIKINNIRHILKNDVSKIKRFRNWYRKYGYGIMRDYNSRNRYQYAKKRGYKKGE